MSHIPDWKKPRYELGHLFGLQHSKDKIIAAVHLHGLPIYGEDDNFATMMAYFGDALMRLE